MKDTTELHSNELENSLAHGFYFNITFFLGEELFEAQNGRIIKSSEVILPAFNEFQSFHFESFFQLQHVMLAVFLENFEHPMYYRKGY